MFEHRGLVLGELTAAVDLSAKQYRFAKISAAFTVTFAAAAADIVLGVIQNKPTLGLAVELLVNGVSRVEAGAAIVAVGPITTDSVGRAITATGTDNVLGVALETCAAAGEFLSIYIFPCIRYQVNGSNVSTRMLTSADNSAKANGFMKVSGDGTVTFAAGPTQSVVGVLTAAPAAAIGSTTSIATSGEVQVKAQANVTAGAEITSHTDGFGRTAVSTELVHGIALTTATTGNLFWMQIIPSNYIKA